jgi:hypothetical protein
MKAKTILPLSTILILIMLIGSAGCIFNFGSSTVQYPEGGYKNAIISISNNGCINTLCRDPGNQYNIKLPQKTANYTMHLETTERYQHAEITFDYVTHIPQSDRFGSYDTSLQNSVGLGISDTTHIFDSTICVTGDMADPTIVINAYNTNPVIVNLTLKEAR